MIICKTCANNKQHHTQKTNRHAKGGGGGAAAAAALGVDDLAALGYNASQARNLLNCLQRLKRTSLQRAADGGGASYVLLPTAAAGGAQ